MELENMALNIEEQFQKEEKRKSAKQSFFKTIKRLRNDKTSISLNSSQLEKALQECDQAENWLKQHQVCGF